MSLLMIALSLLTVPTLSALAGKEENPDLIFLDPRAGPRAFSRRRACTPLNRKLGKKGLSGRVGGDGWGRWRAGHR